MSIILEKLVGLLVLHKTICIEDKELYLYGFRQGLIFLANIVTTILIGTIFGMVIESVVFSVAYLPLRSYAGGYHAKTPLRCYLLSIMIIVATLLAIKLIPWTGFIYVGLVMCAGTAIVFLAPVEDSNKPLDHIERAVYKKRTYIILGVLVLSALACWFIGYLSGAVSITMALVVLAVMLVFGDVRNRL